MHQDRLGVAQHPTSIAGVGADTLRHFSPERDELQKPVRSVGEALPLRPRHVFANQVQRTTVTWKVTTTPVAPLVMLEQFKVSSRHRHHVGLARRRRPAVSPRHPCPRQPRLGGNAHSPTECLSASVNGFLDDRPCDTYRSAAAVATSAPWPATASKGGHGAWVGCPFSGCAGSGCCGRAVR